jgi:hypothetical protein
MSCCFWSKISWWKGSVRRCAVVMQQPVLLSPKFEVKSSHNFTQSPWIITVVYGIDCMACQDEFLVNNSLDIKENEEHALDFTLHLSCLFSISVSLDFPCMAHALLSNHYRGLHHTFSKIYTKFDAVPLLDPSQIHIRSDAWIQITGCQKWTRVLNCVKFCQDSPPKYQRGVSNASKVSSAKNGQFPPHLLVVGDGQHLWMANAALETK